MDVGWYPDPLGNFDKRFFDGKQWTDHVARGGQMLRDELPAVTQPAPAAAPVPAAGTAWLSALGGIVMIAAVALTIAIVAKMDAANVDGNSLYSAVEKLQATLLGLVAFGIGGVLVAVGGRHRS